MVGKTKTVSGTPAEILPLRQGAARYVGNTGFEAFNPNVSPADLLPYQQLFAQNRGRALAQAKESAGNITGSGYENLIGDTTRQSITEENAFLAQLLEGRRQSAAQRYAQLVLGLSTSGVAPPQQVYQPGFLDYLFQGASLAAPAFGAGRAGGNVAASPANNPGYVNPNYYVPGFGG